MKYLLTPIFLGLVTSISFDSKNPISVSAVRSGSKLPQNNVTDSERRIGMYLLCTAKKDMEDMQHSDI